MIGNGTKFRRTWGIDPLSNCFLAVDNISLWYIPRITCIYIYIVYLYIYIYVYIYIYEERTKLYAKSNAMHKLGSSPIGYEGFVQPRAGQGEAKLNQSYNNFVGYAYIYIYIYMNIYIPLVNCYDIIYPIISTYIYTYIYIYINYFICFLPLPGLLHLHLHDLLRVHTRQH